MAKKQSKSISSKQPVPDLYKHTEHIYDDPLFLKHMVSYITDELVVIDAQGRFVYANDAAVEGLGHSRSHILKKTVVDFLTEKISIQQWKKKYFDELKRLRTPLSFRIERRSGGKDIRILDITAVYLSYEGRDFILSFGKDVTGQVAMQRSLQESKNLYYFLTEGAGDGIAALDPAGRLIYANKTLQNMIGLDREEYRGRTFYSFVPHGAAAHVKSIFKKALSGQNQSQGVINAVSLSGEIIPVEISMTPLIKDGKTVNVHMIVRDLRMRRTMEQMERQAEKMDALRYFVTGTAQELKNPLMGLAKRTGVMLKKYGDRDFEYIGYREFKDMISTMETVRDQIQYCYETVQRLTEMGQKKAGIQRGQCHINPIIRNVLKDKGLYMTQCDVAAKTMLLSRDITVRMSSVDFIQILNNLVDNAIQAMPSGGQLTIRTALTAKASEVMIEVKDQGVGIPPEQMEHIFEPFFTTKSRGMYKNSGLGLPIVHSLVSASQGHVRVVSSLRNGTTVRIVLPIFSEKRARV